MYQDFITQALGDVSAIARAQFGKVTGSTKAEDNNQVLTEADIAIGKMLIQKVQQTFPDHNIIEEETGVIDKGSAFTWVIDPIDGTSNFAKGIPTYGCMIGLLQDARPIAGGVALPAFDEIFVGEKGHGAFCNSVQIHVSSETNLLASLVAYGIDGHQEQPDLTRTEVKLLADIILNIRNLRSSNSVFDAMMVASGKYGAYLNRTSKIWDNVAPQIIIEEAGGIYSDFFGKPIDYSQPLKRVDDNFTCCAAAPGLHEQLQKIISNG